MDRTAFLKEVSRDMGYRRFGPRIEEILRGHLRAAKRRLIIGGDQELWIQTLRLGVTPWFRGPVLLMDGCGCHDEIRHSPFDILGVPYSRREVRLFRAKRAPNLFTGDHAVMGDPKLDVAAITIEKPIGNHTMLPGGYAGPHGGLNGRGHARERRT